MSEPLRLGTNVKPWGEIVAVGVTGGERYYWFRDKHGSVAMIPAISVEVSPRGRLEETDGC